MTNNDEEYVQLEFDYEFDEKNKNTADDAAAELTSLGQKMFPHYYSADREELIKRIELAAHAGQPAAIEFVEQAADLEADELAEWVELNEQAEQAARRAEEAKQVAEAVAADLTAQWAARNNSVRTAADEYDLWFQRGIDEYADLTAAEAAKWAGRLAEAKRAAIVRKVLRRGEPEVGDD